MAVEDKVYSYSNVGDKFYIVVLESKLKSKNTPRLVYHSNYYEIRNDWRVWVRILIKESQKYLFVYPSHRLGISSVHLGLDIIAVRSAVYIISPFGTVYYARARSPFARWHSVLRSVFDGTLARAIGARFPRASTDSLTLDYHASACIILRRDLARRSCNLPDFSWCSGGDVL